MLRSNEIYRIKYLNNKNFNAIQMPEAFRAKNYYEMFTECKELSGLFIYDEGIWGRKIAIERLAGSVRL